MEKQFFYTSLARALATNYGIDVKLSRTFRLSGGDINKAYGIELSNGTDIFMKANEKENIDFFICFHKNISTI